MCSSIFVCGRHSFFICLVCLYDISRVCNINCLHIRQLMAYSSIVVSIASSDMKVWNFYIVPLTKMYSREKIPKTPHVKNKNK